MPMTLDHRASIPSRESFHANHEAGQVHRLSYRASSSLSDGPRSVFADEDNYDDDDDMLDEYYDGIIGANPEKSQDSQDALPPALPNKSNLRNSRLLDAFTAATLDSQKPTTLARAAPQDVYLSSEEDASSSADEFSDYDWESESEGSPGSPSRRHSHEDTAKMVSVVYVGKPSIINLSSVRRSVPPQPTQPTHEPPPPPRVVRSSTEPLTSSRASISSTSTGISASAHPPRSSSRRGNLLTKQPPTFLSIDPYAGQTYPNSMDGRRCDIDTPITPKAPSGMLKKGLSIVRKRSRPALREAAHRDSICSTISIQIDRSNTATPNPVESQSQHQVNATKAAQKSARNSTVVYPPSPGQLLSSGRGRILSSFSKRKSLKP
ncbi:hypothetical protein SODALDRAFT_327276 [Sodiomyces alkalinus F11]|uniref:Uncharacterized protein n=1 Tax=Sodiomyces alkalinus (strain CBS 110278 / VKM F-3762 / F11) TaxID=1314773 RepID=A0A3N2Q905_SODAK|nr:hypothetical protein SODALDRAFT_327276 [Sodiomyces alkalinus F11]ROT43105.1 hypothetical protein SODALDRAFT_327276 [Sodiomyces alkalinus F11]